MKKVTLETPYNEMIKVARELNVKFVGIKKEVIVESINKKIDEMKPATPTKGKWHEQENAFPYEVGQMVIINSSYRHKGIHNRIVEVSGPSTKRNAIKGHLINPLNGEKQKTCISLDFKDITSLDEAMALNNDKVENNEETDKELALA